MNDNFKTTVVVPESLIKTEYSDNIFFIGSCFAENIGSRFSQRLFPTVVNPLGVVYNPVSVANNLIDIINCKLLTDDDLRFHNGLWHSFKLHGSFSSPNKQEVLDNANEAIRNAHSHLAKTKTLIVTFGTAWCYSLVENDLIVANCHKYPTHFFKHFKLEVDEIVTLWKDLILKLKEFNPSIRIIFTVSPVRHWKNGAFGNNVSKATLLLSVSRIIDSDKSIDYFPAYEIMMDELRDYRFYDDDMLHPSALAQEYIFNIFAKTYLSKSAQQFGEQSVKISSTLMHRPLHGMTQEYIKLIENTITRIEDFKKRYPSTDVTKLLNKANSLLN